MSISHVDVGADVRRITITGRLDTQGTDTVAAQLEELAAAPRRLVVVDLKPLRFLASIGIRALVTTAKAVKQRGGRMALVVASGSTVMMSLKATGIDQVIPVYDTVEEAERAAVA